MHNLTVDTFALVFYLPWYISVSFSLLSAFCCVHQVSFCPAPLFWIAHATCILLVVAPSISFALPLTPKYTTMLTSLSSSYQHPWLVLPWFENKLKFIYSQSIITQSSICFTNFSAHHCSGHLLFLFKFIFLQVQPVEVLSVRTHSC